MNALPLAIDAACLRQHLVVLGKTGAGKSSTLRHIVEHLLRQGRRVCIIDPKGDWWGLNSSADGKSDGFPVMMLGDFKNKRSDVPIDRQSGKIVAEAISKAKGAFVLGFRGWMPGDLTTFWIDFASTLFNHNQGELFLVIDEVHNFAPKGKVMDPQAGKCLHWTNRLAAEGRGLGLKLMIASQRPQKVHNDTLTCCETLIAMRVIHEADRNAVKEWIDGCGEAAQGKKVLAELAQMPRGQAWVWSPEAGVLEKVTFPMFVSFDSFSENATAPKKWAQVDVEGMKENLARVVEEAKEKDPTHLRAEMSKLRDSNRSLMAQVARLQEEAAPKEVPILTDDDRVRILELRKSAQSLDGRLQTLMEQNLCQIDAEPLPMLPMSLAGPFKPIREDQKAHILPNSPNGAVTGGKRRMMIALAQRPGLNKRQLGLRAGLSSTSGTFGTYLGALRAAGHLEGSGEALSLTRSGLQALGAYEPLPTGRALAAYWIAEVGGGASRMLEVLTSRRGLSLSREELGERAGISSSSGTFGTYLGKLRTLELVSKGFPISASEELFD